MRRNHREDIVLVYRVDSLVSLRDVHVKSQKSEIFPASLMHPLIEKLVNASKDAPVGADMERWVRQHLDGIAAPSMDPFNNILLLTDSYKVSHWVQYPPGTEYIYSYFESRGGVYPSVVFFGLQYILKRYLTGRVVSRSKIEEAEKFAMEHFGTNSLFNRAGWEYILTAHNGHLPLSIRAVPEGEVVTNRNVLMTVVNTDPSCFWLTNFVESILVQVWYPCTVATISRAQKIVIRDFLVKTGTSDESAADFKLHDFGFRGVSSVESSAIGGAAHLVNFHGSDTLPACILLQKYYSEPMAGFSVPASEHSTMTSWGKTGEIEAYRNMLVQYPNGTVACVSDSWDIFNAVSEIWGDELRDMILARGDGRLVIRPDSGDPVEVILRVLDLLGGQEGRAFEPFISRTSTGHRVLPPQVRVIQGDGVDIEMIRKIYSAMDLAGWAADNVGFGSGGSLLQKMNRDTQKFAFKCSAAVVNGEERDVYKDPSTDPGKKSKKGRLMLVKNEAGEWNTDRKNMEQEDHLVEVFRNGNLLVEYTFSDLRQRANIFS
jgi:nicotinamide phosphoribosyltransferase